jgi:hypothetical protein
MRINENGRLMLLALAAVSVILSGSFFFGEDYRPRDYMAWYVAGDLLREHPASLYDPEAQAEQEHQLGVQDGFLPFVYPPFVALPFSALSLLPLRVFRDLILAGNLLLLFLCLHLVLKRYALDKRGKETVVLVASLAFPVYFNLIAGQLAFVSLLLFGLFICDFRAGKPAAGYWVGALSFKPTLMIVPLTVLVARRDWKAAGRAAAVSSGLLLFSLLLVGVNGLYANVGMMSAMRAKEVMHSMQNLRALSHFAGGGEAGWIVLAVAVLMLTAYFAYKGPVDKWLAAVVLLAAVLVSPQLHVYDLSILLLLLGLGVPSGGWYQRFYVLVATLPIASIWLAFPITPLALVLLFSWVVWRWRREHGGLAVEAEVDVKCQTP